MSHSYHHAEERIEEALDAYKNGDYTSLRSAAIDFDLEPHRLQKRAKGLPSKSTRSRTNQRLNDAQELAIMQYVE